MNERKSATKTVTICGMMIAITLILSYTPIGMIPLGTVSATIGHVPTIITAIICGPIEGLIVGLAFGVISLVRALTSPQGVLDPLFVNPLISVLPRMLIGITAGYSYKGLVCLTKKIFKDGKNMLGEYISTIIGGCIGSMTNTIVVLGMLYIIYGQSLMEKLAVENLEAVKTIIWATVATSGIAEMSVAAIISVVVVRSVKRALHL